MKTTMRLFLVLALFSATVFAEGDMGGGGITEDGDMGGGGATCTVDCPTEPDPNATNSDESTSSDLLADLVRLYIENVY